MMLEPPPVGVYLAGFLDLKPLRGQPGADDDRRRLTAGEGALAVEHTVVIAVQDALAVGLDDGLMVLAGHRVIVAYDGGR